MQLYICILFVTDLWEKSRSELSLLKYLEKIIFECIDLEEFVIVSLLMPGILSPFLSLHGALGSPQRHQRLLAAPGAAGFKKSNWPVNNSQIIK